MEWSDQAAAEAALNGNSHAFRTLVERHGRSIFRLAFRMCSNEQDAEDMVQETFLRAYRQLKQFDNRSAFTTWLHRICVNCCLDLLRSKKSRRETKPDLYDVNDRHWLDSVAAPTPGPDRLAASSQIAARLSPALDELSEMERTAFVLRHYEGCEIDEIARTLGVQHNAAKHSVFRAVQKLRRALQPVWGVAAR